MSPTRALLPLHKSIARHLRLLVDTDKRPNDLLKHEVILWGAQQGFKWYVLGGGVTPGDGIYKYKEAFDPESIFPFHVRRIIHNQEAYKLLMQARATYEKGQGNDWKSNPDFFPEYLS